MRQNQTDQLFSAAELGCVPPPQTPSLRGDTHAYVRRGRGQGTETRTVQIWTSAVLIPVRMVVSVVSKRNVGSRVNALGITQAPSVK